MGILDLIFPRKCLGCKTSGSYLCPSCLNRVRIKKALCPLCGRASIDGMTHTKCKKRYGLDGLVSAWEHKGAARQAIAGLKYRFAREIADELATNLLKELKSRGLFFGKNTVLVPIPLSWHRYNWRGFNQGEEIGRVLAQGMGWDFWPDLLIRKKSTYPQVKLKKEQRRQNIKGAFCLNPKRAGTFSQKRLIVFDDVWTTGATIKEAVKILKRGRAKEVWAITLARSGRL